MDDDSDIGVVGKGKYNIIPSSMGFFLIVAVNIPVRNDVNRMQTMNNRMNQENDNTDTMSDEFDSDSKENDNVSRDVFSTTIC